MPVLLAPTTQVVPFDAERQVRQQKSMDEFRAQVVKLWNASPADEVKFGAFRRARSYTWNESFDGLLQTYFVFPSSAKISDGEFARVAVLFRKDSCQLLGSGVVWGAEWSASLPAGVVAKDFSSLKSASARKFTERLSPVRLTVETFGYWAPAMAWVSEAVIGEKLSSEGTVVHSDLSGLACFREANQSSTDLKKSSDLGSAKLDKNTALILKKGHRQLKIRLGGSRPKPPQSWPLVSGSFNILSLPFNSQRKILKISPDAAEIFNPDKIAGAVREEIKNHLHNLDDKAIPVSKREGRFVTVERGLAYGLKIGMHLTGPNGAALHVIRFEPTPQADDAAILLIRKESAEKPLAAGVNLAIDATVYPAK